MKKSLSVLTAILMIVCVLPFHSFALNTPKTGEIWDGSTATAFAGGTGTEADPYLISNGSELAYLAQEVNGGNGYVNVFFELTADIYLNDTNEWENWEMNPPSNEWTAAGNHDIYFSGVFDGNNHKVFGIYINKTGAEATDKYQGLFGYIDGVVKNVSVEESYINAYQYAAGITGFCKGELNNCHNGGNVKTAAESSAAGGIAGAMNAENASITACSNSGKITGVGYVAGICGNAFKGVISDCANSGEISAPYNDVGGIAGGTHASVISCSNTGKVTGSAFVGGIVGMKYENTVENCSNSGDVAGETNVGGIVGYNYGGAINTSSNSGNICASGWFTGGINGYCCADGSISDCQNTGSINGNEYTGGIAGAGVSVVECCNTGDIAGACNVGGIIGNIEDIPGNIDNCCNTGNISGIDNVGGAVGHGPVGTVKGFSNSGSISGKLNIGGIVGYAIYTQVKTSYNKGNISGNGNVGGIAGINYDTSVSDCYNIGSISGKSNIGGLVGRCEGLIENSYNAGQVTGQSFTGAINGYITEYNSTFNCYYRIAVCPEGDELGIPLTYEQMTDAANYAGFDFASKWTMAGNTEYPFAELIENNHTTDAGDEPISPIDPNPTEAPVPTDEPIAYDEIRFDFETEESLNGWNWEDSDGDGYNWVWIYDGAAGGYQVPEGLGMMNSQSYINDLGPLAVDDWLISPSVPGGGKVSFLMVGQDVESSSDVVGVYVSSDGGETWSDELSYFIATNSVQTFETDLSQFEGQNVRIAFRHYDAVQFMVNLDLVIVSIPADDAPVTEPPTETPSETPSETPTETPNPPENVLFGFGGEYQVNAGDTIEIPFTVEGDFECNTADFLIEFDSAFITINGIFTGSVMDNIFDVGGIPFLDTPTADSVVFSVECPDSGFTANGEMILLSFIVSESVPNGTEIPITLTVNEFSKNLPDGTSVEIPYEVENGLLTVSSEEPPTAEPPTEEPPTEEPPTEAPPTEEPPTEEPPTEMPTEPPEPPTTGFISLAGIGIAAILAGTGVVLFRRKRK